MFSTTPFYNRSIRKYVVAFGTLFNNISIQRFDSTNENVSTIKVPIAYGPKEKYLRRINEKASIDEGTDVKMTVPRLSFELMEPTYDPSRKISDLNRIYNTTPDSTSMYNYVYERVPYNFPFQLNAITKHFDDSLQIVEQILPYFTPSVNISINELSSPTVKSDTSIILESVAKEDNWDGDYETVRDIIWTFNFTLKGYLYKDPRNTIGLIEEIIIDNYIYDGTDDSGKASSRINIIADPFGSSADDFTGYVVTKEIYPFPDRT